MNHLNAPATKMVATRCACCGTPLVDAESVETGIGPVCRKKHGYVTPDVEVDVAAVAVIAATLPAEIFADVVDGATTARVLANRLVYRIACLRDVGGTTALAQRVSLINAVHELGYRTLARRCVEDMAKIRIEPLDAENYAVHAPFSPHFNEKVRNVKGARWVKNPSGKGGYRRVPVAQKAALWACLRAAFAGKAAVGPKGAFVIA